MRFKAFAIIPHAGEIEIKPLVLCRECRYFDCAGCVLGHQCKADGEWFCADGEKKREGTRRYYTQDGTISWEEEDDAADLC